MKSLIDFFKGVVELLNVQAESGFGGKEENPESEKVLDAYKWFLEQIKDEKNTPTKSYSNTNRMVIHRH